MKLSGAKFATSQIPQLISGSGLSTAALQGFSAVWQDIPAQDRKTAETVDESCLLSLMQDNLHDQFYTKDLQKVSDSLSRGCRDLVRGGMFGDMMTKSEEIYRLASIISLQVLLRKGQQIILTVRELERPALTK